MIVSDIFVEKIVNTFLDKIADLIGKQKNKNELKNEIRKCFDRYFKEQYQNIPLSEEFDVHKLHEFLSENLETRVLSCFLAGSDEEREYYHKALLDSSYKIAHADTKAKQHNVFAYVNSILSAIHSVFFSQIPKGDLFLINQQTKDLIKAYKSYIQDENQKLMRFIEYYGSFAKYIDSITPEPFQRNSIKTPLGLNWRFRYLNPEIGFVRREKQFQLLDDFLDREDPFLSLAITGYGGIGKSRLLHQYKLELRSNTEWKALIADRSAIDRICSSNFTEWKYPKKLLLVFDYAGENAEQIGKWIQAISNSTARPEKIRIVLLERQGLTSNNDQPIQPRWYQQMNKASGYSLEKIQYQYGNDPKENGFYELPRLSKDEMLQVMDKLPNSKRKLTTEEKEQIYEKIAGFAKDFNDERFNTPLIALLSTDAYLDGKSLLNPEQLMSYVIERDKDSWKRALKGYPEPDKLVDALERTLVFATATGGCDITDKAFKSISPLAKEDANLLIDNLKKEGVHHLSALVAGDTQSHPQLEPLKPDIIGEYFVLNYFSQNMHSGNCEEFIKACWGKTEEFLSFLILCVRSYLERFLDLVFENDPVLFQGADPLSQSIVLFEMTTLPNISTAEKALERMGELYEKLEKLKKFAELEKHAILYAMGLFNLSAEQKDAQALQSTTDKLETLNNKCPDDTEIALSYAMGLVNLSAEQKDAQALQSTTDKLKALNDRWPNDAKIALSYAMGLVNLSAEQEDAKTRQVTTDKLETLNNKWPDNAQIALSYAMALVNLSAEQEDAQACRSTTDKLGALNNKWPNDAEIALRYAMALVSLSAEQEDAKTRQSTTGKLKTLSDRWPDDAKIALRYAMGLFNLSAEQEDAETRQSSTDKLEALSDRWPDDAKIALKYAMGLVNLSAEQKDAKTRQSTTDKLEALSDRWPDDAKIALSYGRGLVNLSAKQEDAQARRSTTDKLEALNNKWPDDAQIGFIYAGGLFNLSLKQEDAQTLQITIDKLKALSDRWPDNSIIKEVCRSAKR